MVNPLDWVRDGNLSVVKGIDGLGRADDHVA